MGLRIDILCNDGSPLGIVYGDVMGNYARVGIGGAELALFTMCEQWGKEGHQVRLYNNPRIESDAPNFQQLALKEFNRNMDRDILIIFRSPNERIWPPTKGLKVWWSCDQYTVGDFAEFASHVDKIVTISHFHTKHFVIAYNIRNTTIIDLPVRMSDYVDTPERNLKKVLFSSVPDRGLKEMRTIWRKVVSEVPDAELFITSDYRLWGSDALDENFRLMFLKDKNVHYLGAVRRPELIREQLTSGVMLYPCTYDELFCIACAEGLVSGAMPITSEQGALETTNMYKKIQGPMYNPDVVHTFEDVAIKELTQPDMAKRKAVQEAARIRFDPANISAQWNEKIFKTG